MTDPPAVDIREARNEDASVIADLLGELGYPTSPAEVLDRLAALDRTDLVLLADDGAGLIALHRVARLERAPLLRITVLVVRAARRGTGAGQALMHAAEDTARQWGCELIEVSTGTRPERAVAHRFYQAAGFHDAASASVRYWKRTAV